MGASLNRLIDEAMERQKRVSLSGYSLLDDPVDDDDTQDDDEEETE